MPALFLVFGKPCFDVLDDGYEIQPHQKVSIAPAWAISQTVDLFHCCPETVTNAKSYPPALVGGLHPR
ncbi:hypothetical protein GF312_00095 [Candidatus Poribacteria bacterium]|nr:hypothetical protein [Candidatus Poribacteria bacterium]